QDQAAYAIPADDVVREDLSQLVPVRSVVTPGVVHSLRPHARVEPVIRLAGNISGATNVTGIAVLGLGGQALRGIDGWRSDFASSSPAELAARPQAAGAARPRGGPR